MTQQATSDLPLLGHWIGGATCSAVGAVPSCDERCHGILMLAHKKTSRQAAFGLDALDH